MHPLVFRYLKRASILGVAAVCLLLSTGCSGLFFQPTREHVQTPYLAAADITDLYFPSSDGTQLHAWLVKPTTSPPKATILFFHGNAQNVSTHLHGVLWLVEEGYQVVAFDYRGYGKSEGEPGMEGVHADGNAALEYVYTMDQVDPGRVIVLGQSLGGAIALTTMARSPRCDSVRLLIADSAFSGYRRIFREKLGSFFLTWPFQYPLSYLVGDEQSPERWLDEMCNVPVLFLHGDRDRVVPVSHSKRMHKVAADPKGLWIIAGAVHIQGLTNPELRATLLDKFDTILTQGVGGDPDKGREYR